MTSITNTSRSSKKVIGRHKKRKKQIKRIIRKIISFVFVPIYFSPSVLLLLTPIRFVINSNPGRIGHLAAEFDCFLKEMLLGDRPRVTAVALLSSKEVANDCLLQHWESRIYVARNRLLRNLLKPFLYFPYLRITLYETVTAIDETADYPSVLARWGSRPPLLSLSESHKVRGEECLRELGVPPDSWFVCVHSREGGYSPKDEYINAHRNSDIATYGLAMQAIVDRGGWCIRVGDASMKPLQQMNGVIDYANSNLKSDWMDIFLGAKCRFFLGNSSGLCVVSTVFGVPSALANMTPLSNAYPNGAFDLGIPMLVRRQSGDLIPFAEVFNSPIANFRYAARFEESGLIAVNNGPEEIRELAIEMIDRLNDVATYTALDKDLQNSFRALFRPGHFSFGSAARLGREFLREHSDLISTRA